MIFYHIPGNLKRIQKKDTNLRGQISEDIGGAQKKETFVLHFYTF